MGCSGREPGLRVDRAVGALGTVDYKPFGWSIAPTGLESPAYTYDPEPVEVMISCGSAMGALAVSFMDIRRERPAWPFDPVGVRNSNLRKGIGRCWRE